MANNLENLGTNEFDIRRNKINTFQDSIKNYKQQDKENNLLKPLLNKKLEF